MKQKKIIEYFNFRLHFKVQLVLINKSLICYLGIEQSPLFVLYSDAGDEQLMVSVGELIELYYEDTRGDPQDNELLTFRANVADKE